jgi:hypothetical protein
MQGPRARLQRPFSGLPMCQVSRIYTAGVKLTHSHFHQPLRNLQHGADALFIAPDTNIVFVQDVMACAGRQ